MRSKDKVESPPPPVVSIQAALGFVSNETEQDFFHEMALRMSGSIRLLLSSSVVQRVVDDTTIIAEAALSPTTTIESDDSTNMEQNRSSLSSTTMTMTTSSKLFDPRGSQFLDFRLATDDYSLAKPSLV